MRRISAMVLALPLLAVSACASDGGRTAGSEVSSAPSATSPVATDATVPTTSGPGPLPGEMCATGSPIMAAYDLATGDFRWVACADGGGMFLAAAATADKVWVQQSGTTTSRFVLDAATGKTLEGVDANDVPDDADYWTQGPPSGGGVRVHGGQDDPLVGVDDATGAVVWQAEGHPYFDDVWAYGDGAVFVDAWDPTGARPGSWIAAYEVATGVERWTWSPDAGFASPWHVTGDRLFALGADLWVLSTADASVLWHTEYGESATGYPRMFGVLANDDTVFVSFTSEASGGD